MMVLVTKNHILRINKHKYKGSGILNSAITNLPVELHLIDGTKKYNWCGPGTRVDTRILWENGKPIKALTPPINRLDEGCMYHDIAYTKYNDIEHRNKADEELKKVSTEFYKNSVKNKDKWNALIVNKVMDFKIKNKI